MVTLLRRSLVLAALMFWQGGFLFYASVVVPIGKEVLGTDVDQGMITRRVTVYLNLAGGAALLPLLWEAAAGRGGGKWLRRLRWLALAVVAVTQGMLFWLHPRLDALLDPERVRILDRGAFRAGHRLYLWVSTVQWGAALVFAVLTLWTWQARGRAGTLPPVSREEQPG